MLLNEINTRMQLLDQTLKQYRRLGIEWANAEHDYKVILSQKTLELRDSGQPATLINIIVYGDKEVAKARLKRDIAKTTYEACMEGLNVYKLELRVLNDQFKTEYVNE